MTKRPSDDLPASGGGREATVDFVGPASTPAPDFAGPARTENFVGPASAATGGAAGELPIVARAHYEVLSEHARGGLGRIVRARDIRTGRVVAIKEMLGKSDDTARRFAREALITANLQHPAIVPVYELGRWESGEPFYAMKLVAGRSFEEVIKDCKTLDERLARLPVVVSVSEALAYAHGRGIIHRDLKPANVLVGDLGETVVIDWGLAKALDQADIAAGSVDPVVVPDEMAPMRTIVGAVMGTPAYMPPEQTRGENTDERSDVYSIGALLYHLISGRAPYAEKRATTAKDLVKIVTAEPAMPLDEREPGTPPELVTIVGKAMAREQAQRYASAGELTEDLRRFTTGQLVRAHHYDRRTLFGRWLRRNRAPVTVGIVLALAVVGVATWGVNGIITEKNHVAAQRDIARGETSRAEEGLAAALYEKGRVAEGQQEWARAAMYYAAARRHHDTEGSKWAAGLAEARAVIPSVRFTGHKAWVHAVAISPDGTRVATVDDAGELRVWSPTDGRVLGARTMGKQALYAVAFSPTGHELAVGGDDGVVARMSLDLAPIAELHTGAGRVWSLAYSPDGGRLASGSEDANVRLWSLAGGEQRGPRVFSGHRQRVYAVAFSADGRHLVSGCDDRHVRVWDVATGSFIVRGEHKAGGIRVAAFAPPGDTVVTSGWDHQVRVWRGTDPVPDEWSELDAVHALAISPGGDVVVTGGEMNVIHAWDLSTHHLITTLDAPGGQTSALAFSNDGHWLVTAGKAAPIAWDATAFRRLAAVGHRADVVGLSFSRDGKRFVSGGLDHTLRLWDTETGTEQWRPISTGNLQCAEGVAMIAPDAFVTSCDDETFRRYDGKGSPAVLKTDGWLRQVSLSPDGATVAAGHPFGRLGLIDVAQWKVLTYKTAHAHFIEGVQYNRTGALVTASLDDHVRVWRGRELALETDVKVGTDNGVLAASLAPDGSLLAIGTQEGSIDVWDVRTGAWRVRDAGAGKLSTVWKVLFSPDSKQAFTVSDDGLVRIWDAATWTAPVLLDAGEGPALSIALSPDGAMVIAGYKSGAIAMWDVATHQLHERIGGRTRDRGSCSDLPTQAWSDDGHRAIVANACASTPQAYFEHLATRTHQRLDGEVDVTWEWLGEP